MIDPPKIVQTPRRRTAVIRITIPREQIREVMGPAFAELAAACAAQGLSPAGPMFSHHHRMDPAVFDFEVGVPLDASIAPTGRVIAGELPAETVARTLYRGPYETLGAAWGEFQGWIQSHGHRTRPNLWECYVAGPESSPNPADWQTELNQPLET